MKFAFKPVQGDTVPLRVTVQLNAAPYDLTGSKLFFTAKEDNAQDDADALISLDSISGSIVFPDAVNGIALITLTPAITAACPTDVPLLCDVQLVSASGQVFTVATGKLTFVEQTTRRTN